MAGGFEWTVMSDGHGPYHNVLAGNDRQRCCSHILRDSYNLREWKFGGAAELHSELKGLVNGAVAWLGGRHCRRMREEKAASCQRAAGRLTDRYARHGGRMERFGAKLRSTARSLFTFVRIPGVPPTNNLAEQVIRRLVLWRKGHGQVKSGRGLGSGGYCSPASGRGASGTSTCGSSCTRGSRRGVGGGGWWT